MNNHSHGRKIFKRIGRGLGGALGLLLTLCLVTGIAGIGITPVLAAPPPIPDYFSGSVMIGSAQAPAGTAITAKDAGVLVGTATVDSSGNYGISVSGTTSGDTIQFYVGGIAAQTGTFTSGEFPLLNLTIPAPTYAVTLGTITRVSGDTDSTVTIATSPAIAGATVTLTVVP